MGIRKTTEEFIEEAKRIHGDRYSYDKTIYSGSQRKLIITCPTHGEFSQSPSNHLIGQGCPKCSGNYRSNTEEFIIKARTIHGDKYDYSKVDYINATTKVTIVCSIHGKFEQQPNSHLQGYGCTKCSGRLKYTYDKCYEIAKKYEWLSDFRKDDNNCYGACVKKHYLKDFTWLKRNYDKNENIITSRKHLIYKYDFPEYNTVYIGLTVNLERRDNEHFKKGSVYKFCKENNLDIPKPKIIEGNLSLDEAKIREQYWIDYHKSQGYILLNKTKAGAVGLLCKVKTGNETNEFIAKAKQVHGDNYDYSKVGYINAITKVTIICPKHGDFLQTPDSHLQGRGCSKCRGEKLSDRYRGTKEQFISKAIEVHGGKYDYSKVEYVNNHTEVIIICSTHGVFEQTPINHLQGKGCPKCGKERRVKIRTKWTYEACKGESEKYKSRNDFRKGNETVYQVSWKNKWLDEFFPKK